MDFSIHPYKDGDVKMDERKSAVECAGTEKGKQKQEVGIVGFESKVELEGRWVGGET